MKRHLVNLSEEDKTCLKLGRMVATMIRDLAKAGDDRAYARRGITFPGGAIHLFVANKLELAELFERVANGIYDIETAIPPSQVN